jgi:predicted nucleotide-binding protein (sugar kinase/HSP70/actin superfamily)
MQGFRFYKKAHDLRELAEITDEVVSLANQFGEGWLLTAEMIAMLNEGIGNIVCLQPFGCIANHITGKGMENKLREMFPHLNLLSLDMDAGASEVNLLNRLHFMVTAAREQVAREKGTLAEPETFQRFAIPTLWAQELYMFNSYASLEVEKWRAWVSALGLMEKARKIRRKISL